MTRIKRRLDVSIIYTIPVNVYFRTATRLDTQPNFVHASHIKLRISVAIQSTFKCNLPELLPAGSN